MDVDDLLATVCAGSSAPLRDSRRKPYLLFSCLLDGRPRLDTRHSTLDTRHSTLDTQHSALDTRHATRDTRYSTLDTLDTTTAHISTSESLHAYCYLLCLRYCTALFINCNTPIPTT